MSTHNKNNESNQETIDLEEIVGKAMEEAEKKREKVAEEDFLIEEKAESPAGPPVTPSSESPKDESNELKEQIKSWNDKYLRLMAEFDNYKRRTSREYQQLIEHANEKLLLEIIEVRENFERALKTTEKEHDAATIVDGMRLIFAKFSEILQKNGLEVFSDEGKPFNPEHHDALVHVSHAEINEGSIVETYERGYRLKGKVIKHARVVISKGAQETNATQEQAAATDAEVTFEKKDGKK